MRCDVTLEETGSGQEWALIRMIDGWCVQPRAGTEVALGGGSWLSRPVWIQGDEPTVVLLRRGGHEARLAVQQVSLADYQQQAAGAQELVPAGAGGGDWQTIGREGGSADIKLAGLDVAVRHARVRLRGDGSVDVRDLSHGLGVFVDGQPVLATRVPRGKSFVIGHHRLRSGEAGLIAETVRRSPVLECRDVCIQYRDRKGPSLVGIEFVLNTHGFMTVIGPSSAGKSTLFRPLLGEVENVTGSMGFVGDPLPPSGLPSGLVSFLPQEDHLPTDLTVRQAIRLAAGLRLAADLSETEITRRTDVVMARLELTEHAGTDIGAVSGGTRKRVSLALELLSDPILLILDEPTSGLDEGLDRRLMRQLADLARDGTAILLITHSMVNLHESELVLAINSRGTVGYLGPPLEMIAAFSAQSYADVMDDLREGASARQGRPVQVTSPSSGKSLPAPAPMPRNRTSVLAARELRRLLPSARSRHGSRRRMLAKPALHLLVAPLVVASLAGLVDPRGLAATRLSPNPQLTAVLSLLSISATFFAAAVTSGSIVGDYAMISREARWGIRARSVVVSRFLVLGTVALSQGGLTSLLFLMLRPGPVAGDGLPGPLLLAVSLLLLSGASAAMGLFVSAIARTVQQGIFALMMLSAVQVLFSGLITPLGAPGNLGAWLLAGLSMATPIRWAVAALGAGIGLNSVPGLAPDALWSHDIGHVAVAWSALVALTAAYVSAAVAVLSARLRRRL
jgi:ABC-type multidrug transport system ATPase subunit